MTSKKLADSTVSQLKLSKKVVSCNPEYTIGEVLKVLQERKIGLIVIVEGEVPVGIFTERDYILKVAGKEVEVFDKKISEFMTTNPICIDYQENLKRVLKFIRIKHFRHLLIVDDRKHLKGVISIKDIIDYIVDSHLL